MYLARICAVQLVFLKKEKGKRKNIEELFFFCIIATFYHVKY